MERKLKRSEREFKILVRLFINEYFELDESETRDYTASYFDIEHCFLISDLSLDYPEIKKNTVIKYMIMNYPFLQKAHKRIKIKGIDLGEKKGNHRILKNIKVKDGIIK